MLETGSKVIGFTLLDEHDSPVALRGLRRKKVVLYFYPKGGASGYTRQACTFEVAHEEFKREDIVVIGIGENSSASHMRFKEKHKLPFLLLSDTELSVIQTYDVWKEEKLCRKTHTGVTCSTYVIGEEGVAIKIFGKASPASNAVDILQYVKDIRQTPLYTLL